MYLPNVFGLIKQNIIDLFEEKEIGAVRRVDFFQQEGRSYLSAMIHLDYWYDTETAWLAYDSILLTFADQQSSSYNLYFHKGSRYCYLTLCKMTAPYVPETHKNIHQIAVELEEQRALIAELTEKLDAVQSARAAHPFDFKSASPFQSATPFQSASPFKKPLLPLAVQPSGLPRSFLPSFSKIPYVKLPNHIMLDKEPSAVFYLIQNYLRLNELSVSVYHSLGRFEVEDTANDNRLTIRVYHDGPDSVANGKTMVEFEPISRENRWAFMELVNEIKREITSEEKTWSEIADALDEDGAKVIEWETTQEELAAAYDKLSQGDYDDDWEKQFVELMQPIEVSVRHWVTKNFCGNN